MSAGNVPAPRGKNIADDKSAELHNFEGRGEAKVENKKKQKIKIKEIKLQEKRESSFFDQIMKLDSSRKIKSRKEPNWVIR